MIPVSSTRAGKLSWNDLEWIRAEVERLRSLGRRLTDNELAWLKTLTDREAELREDHR